MDQSHTEAVLRKMISDALAALVPAFAVVETNPLAAKVLIQEALKSLHPPIEAGGTTIEGMVDSDRPLPAIS